MSYDQYRAAARFLAGKRREKFEWQLIERCYTTHAPTLTEGLFKALFDSPLNQRVQQHSMSGTIDRLRGVRRNVGPTSRPSDKIVYHTDSENFSGLINGKRFTNFNQQKFHDHLVIDHGFGHKEAHSFANKVIDHAEREHFERVKHHAIKAQEHSTAHETMPDGPAKQFHAARAIHHWEHAEKLGLNTYSYSQDDLKDHKSFFHRYRKVKAEEATLKKQQGI